MSDAALMYVSSALTGVLVALVLADTALRLRRRRRVLRLWMPPVFVAAQLAVDAARLAAGGDSVELRVTAAAHVGFGVLVVFATLTIRRFDAHIARVRAETAALRAQYQADLRDRGGR